MVEVTVTDSNDNTIMYKGLFTTLKLAKSEYHRIQSYYKNDRYHIEVNKD